AFKPTESGSKSANRATTGPESRIHQDERSSSRVGRKHRTSDKAQPAKPEQEHADRRKRNRGTRKVLDLSVVVFSNPGTQQPDTRQRTPAANRMHQSRSRKIMKPPG